MAFPYDFGFVPSTLGGDGDPLDVLVLMDEPAFTGCVLSCRLIGVIRGRQKTPDGREENDRLVAVERNQHRLVTVHALADLRPGFLQELEDFFVNYHELDGEKYKVTGCGGPAAAGRVLKAGQRAAKRKPR